MAFLSQGFKNLQWYSMTKKQEKTQCFLLLFFFLARKREEGLPGDVIPCQASP